MMGDLQNRSVATCNEKRQGMLLKLGMLVLRGRPWRNIKGNHNDFST